VSLPTFERLQRKDCLDQLAPVDYRWHPKIDVCWDIRRGLPFRSGSIAGIFTEHCIEHLSLFAPDFGLNGPCSKLLIECRRVLRPGSIIRVVVPDARIYLGTYVQRTGGKADKLFPYEPAGSDWLPILHVNRVFYDGRQFAGGHCTMFDFDLLAQVLTTAGFLDVKRKAFQSGEDEMLLIDSPGREPESIYIEATR